MKKVYPEKILYWMAISLLAYMPFHLFLSRWLSQYTGGLGQWDAAKDILTLFALAIAILLTLKHKLFKSKEVKLLFVLTALYGLLHLLFIIFDRPDQDLRSFIVATLYNGRIFAYLFIGLIAAILNDVSKKTLIQIVLVASTITCVFALVQYIAPKDLMTHFGYSVERGAKPSFFIDDKPDFPRVMSTIRDPNSYGAYLILPISVLWIYLISNKHKNKRMLLFGLLGLHGLALFLTFSRGAWLGAIIAVSLVTGLLYHRQLITFSKKKWLPITTIIACVLIFGFLMRSTYVFKNLVFHSDESTVMADPNELRTQLQGKAIKSIVDQPQGYGPGTAGLVSIGNPKGTFLTENYYLQIAYEVGVVGVLIFLALLFTVATKVLRLKDRYSKSLLLATLVAYGFVGMLIHLWSNEAVAAQWWILAGLTLALPHTKIKKAKRLITPHLDRNVL